MKGNLYSVLSSISCSMGLSRTHDFPHPSYEEWSSKQGPVEQMEHLLKKYIEQDSRPGDFQKARFVKVCLLICMMRRMNTSKSPNFFLESTYFMTSSTIFTLLAFIQSNCSLDHSAVHYLDHESPTKTVNIRYPARITMQNQINACQVFREARSDSHGCNRDSAVLHLSN